MRDDSSGSSMIWPATPVADVVTGAMVEAAAAAGWDGTGGAPALFVFPYQLVQRIRRSVGGHAMGCFMF